MALFTPNIEKLKANRDEKKLIKALKSSSFNIQIEAANALGDLYVKSAVNPLVDLLYDWNSDVQFAAVNALGKIASPKALTPLLTIYQKEKHLQEVALNAIIEMGFEAIDPLIDFVIEGTAPNQEEIVDILVSFGEKTFIELQKRFADQYSPHRAVFLNILARFDYEESIDILLDVISTESQYEIKSVAQKLLIGMGSRAVGKVLETAEFPNSDLHPLLDILSQIGDQRCQPFFLEYLNSSDVQLRLMAAKGLDKAGWLPRKNETGVWYLIAKQKWKSIIPLGAMAIGPLGRVISDMDETVKNAALDTLAQIGETGSETLIELLKSRYAEKRIQAAVTIGKLKEVKYITPLSNCLSDIDERVRRAAIESLGRIADARCINPLIMALKDDDPMCRKVAVLYVSRFEDERLIPIFISMFEDNVPTVPDTIVQAFKSIGEKAVDPLIEALERASSFTKKYAALSLGVLADVRAVPPLIEIVRDKNWQVRKAGALALGQMQDKRAISILGMSLEDEKEEVAIESAKALAKIGSPAIPTLIKMLMGHRINKFAVLALKSMSNNMFGPIIALLRHPDSSTRQAVVKILDLIEWKPQKDELGAAYYISKQEWEKGVEVGESALEPLLDVLGDQERWNRKAAAENLGKLKDVKAIDYLIQSLKDEFWEVREAAMNSLISMGRKAVEPLINSLVSGDKKAVKSIAMTLAEIGDKRAVKPLIYILKDKRQFVREAAGLALEKLEALNSEIRCQNCGKPTHESHESGDICPFCNLELHIKSAVVEEEPHTPVKYMEL